MVALVTYNLLLERHQIVHGNNMPIDLEPQGLDFLGVE